MTPLERSTTAAIAFVFFLCLTANATQILVNGDFEAGSLTGWTETDKTLVAGSWFVSSTSLSPIFGLATAGAKSGTWYALTDQEGPGAHALTQSFTVAPGSTVLLSFDMFVNSYATVSKPASLDYTVVPNQQGRVDLLTGAATPFDVNAGVLFNFYDGADAGANPNPYTHYAFDISSLVAPGGTYQIRFAEADNQLFLNMGIDNVVVDVAPEPGTAGLVAIGMIIVLTGIRRKALGCHSPSC